MGFRLCGCRLQGSRLRGEGAGLSFSESGRKVVGRKHTAFKSWQEVGCFAWTGSESRFQVRGLAFRRSWPQTPLTLRAAILVEARMPAEQNLLKGRSLWRSLPYKIESLGTPEPFFDPKSYTWALCMSRRASICFSFVLQGCMQHTMPKKPVLVVVSHSWHIGQKAKS